MDNRGIDFDPGWVNRELQDLRRQIEGLRSERRAQSTTVEDGDFTVSGGGAVVIKDGGDLRTEHPNSATAMQVGGLTTGGGNPAEGWVLRDPSGVLIAAAYTDTVNGERVVIFGGDVSNPLELLQARAEDVYLGATTGDVYLDAVAGDIFLAVSAGRRVFIGHETTAAAANCFINTDGSIWRSTSSRRYKTDIESADIDVEAVLALQPRVFRTVAEVAADGEQAPTHSGFIAEEAADLGLEHWVTRDDDGEPESFAYSQWCVAQQAVIQRQQQQIDDLTARLNALTGQA